MVTRHEKRQGIFTIKVRVYWQDTDAGGVVNHARYVNFAERARSEWLNHWGNPHEKKLWQQGVMFVVRSMTVDFLASATLDDILIVTCRCVKKGRVSAVFDQEILCQDRKIVRFHVKIASINRQGKIVPFPDCVHFEVE